MEACELGKETRTDAINHSIQLYAYYRRAIHDGCTLLVRDPDGREREVILL
jgi:hypothetical protein